MHKIFLLFVIMLNILCNTMFAQEQGENKNSILAIVNSKILTRYDVEQRKKITYLYYISGVKEKFTDEQILEKLILEELYMEFLSTRNMLPSDSDIVEAFEQMTNNINIANKTLEQKIEIPRDVLYEFVFKLVVMQTIQQALISQDQSIILPQSKKVLTKEQGVEVKFLSFKLENLDKQSYQKFQNLHKKIAQLSNKKMLKLKENLSQFGNNVKVMFCNTNSLSLPIRQRAIVHDSRAQSVSSVFLNDDNMFEFVVIYNKETYFNKQRIHTVNQQLIYDRINVTLKEFNQMLKNEAFIEIF